MKRTAVVILLLVLALAVAPLALAANGKGKHGKAHGKSKFQLNGVVKSVTAGPDSLTVIVKAGSRTVKEAPAEGLTLTVVSETRYVDATADEDDDATTAGTAPPALANLVGARVHVGGVIASIAGSTSVSFVAKKVIVQRWPEVTPMAPAPTQSVTP